MVQIIHMQPKQSWQNALGSAVGEGLSEGVKINAAKQARREEQAAQFEYDSLRDKQKELMTIRAEERGKENIFNYAGMIAERHYKKGTPEYDKARMAIYAGGVADPSSLKQFGQMSPYQMETYAGDFITHAMDNMKAAGQGEPGEEGVEQPGQTGQSGQTGQNGQQAPNQAPQTQVPAEQGPQVVFDDRIAKPQEQIGQTGQTGQQEPQAPQGQKQGSVKGEQWINGKKYINGRIADPFKTDDPEEAIKSIYYFNNPENAKQMEKFWTDAQDTKIKQQTLEQAKIKSGTLVSREAREQTRFENEVLEKPHEALQTFQDNAEKAQYLDQNLQSLRTLLRQGNIDVTGNRILNALGIDYENWLSLDEGLQIKLVRQQFPNVVQKFAGAGKVLDKEFEAYTKTFAHLLQNIEGQIKVTDMQALENQIPIIKNQVAMELEKQYRDKGIALPQDFKMKVDRAAQPQLDAVYELMYQIMAPGMPPLKELRNSEYLRDKKGQLGVVPSDKVEELLKTGEYKRA